MDGSVAKTGRSILAKIVHQIKRYLIFICLLLCYHTDKVGLMVIQNSESGAFMERRRMIWKIT